MQALVFENSLARTLATKLVGQVLARAYVGPTSPMRHRNIPEPQLPADDWLLVRTRLCGLCGSDYKQVFLNGSYDNPMTSLISFPQVLGHEAVGVVERTGPAVTRHRVGDRVLLDPWLGCGPRGLAPCRWCRTGDYAQCENFTRGALAPGIHSGNCRDASGAFAEFFPAHESQCIPIPDDVDDEVAVLADPFSVSLHGILHGPAPEAATVLVYGAGTLGLAAVAVLKALYARVRVIVVARYGHQRRLAERFGADHVLEHRPAAAVIEAVAGLTGSEIRRPWRGLPMLAGGVDLIYDTVGLPETLEVGVRVTRPRGTVVVSGVEIPRRFEWTPLYFKEVSLVGSNAFGMETIGDRRMHAMEWYFEMVGQGRIDLTPIISHRYRLGQYKRAFMDCYDQGRSGAVKVLFDYRS